MAPMQNFSAAPVLDSIIATMVDGLIAIDAESRIRLFNPACERIFGWSEEEIAGERIERLMPSPYRDEHQNFVNHYERTGETRIIGIGREVKGLHKSGRIFPMHLSVGEITTGPLRGYVGVVRDLTVEVDRRERLESLQQSHFHLSRLTSMNQLGAAIAHELNQPLTALTNYMEAGSALLSRGDPDAQIRDRLESVMTRSAEQARRAAQLLSRLRQFVERGETERKLVDPQDICADALSLIRPAFQSSAIEFRTEFDENVSDLLCDPIQIQQVLINLIRNGCEAMNSVDAPKTLTVACQDQGDTIVISVSDTGEGLAEDMMDSLFTPFQSSKTDGMGVGLSISQSIISAHGGRLEAMSNNPRGTIFHVTLPKAEAIQ